MCFVDLLNQKEQQVALKRVRAVMEENSSPKASYSEIDVIKPWHRLLCVECRGRGLLAFSVEPSHVVASQRRAGPTQTGSFDPSILLKPGSGRGAIQHFLALWDCETPLVEL